MSKMKNVVQRSVIATSIPDGLEKRRTQIDKIQNPLKHLTALTLHGLAIRHPHTMAQLFGLHGQEQPALVVGDGTDTVVYKISKPMVAKVHQQSFGMNTANQVRLAVTNSDRHRRMIRHLPLLAVPEHTSIIAHPQYPDMSVVATMQPYKQVSDPKLFVTDETAIDYAALGELLAAHPNTLGQLQQLIRGSFDCYEQDGLMPDLCGPGNLTLDHDKGALLMIDGQPHADGSSAVKQTLGRLESLAEAVA